MFTVDGAFVKTIGSDDIGDHVFHVLCSGSSVFVLELSRHRVCVFSLETGALIRTFGTRGPENGQFDHPSSLAAHNNKLFVLDGLVLRVQVFQ
jgi:hypothetical protein